MRGFLIYCQTVATGTVDDVANDGRVDVGWVRVPTSAVHRLLEAFRSPKIIMSVPRGPGAQA
jgi:hypothetical protein